MAIIRRTRKRDGRTVYLVRLRDPHGKQYAVSFETERAAKAYEAAQRADRSRGTWVDPRLGDRPFSEIAEEWLQSRPRKKSGSIARDRSILETHVVPVLGARRISSVTRLDVQKLVNGWLDRFEPSTVVRMFAVVRAVCTYAVDNELRAHNPCRKIELPEVRPRDSEILDRPDLQRLAEALGDYGPMVYLALMGPRWGEIAGLLIGHLRLSGADPAITIRLQRTRGEKGRMISSTPKSRNSERPLAIPDWLGSMLADHLSTRRDVSEDDYVFVSPDGAPLHYSNWRRRVWVPAVEKIGFPDLHFHDLRHVAATRLDEAGVGDKIKERRMGATKAVVDRVYTQGTDPADRAAADLVGEILRPRSKPPT
ncbi:MAG TPA: site-specific integrase [Chloroflexota bacterium]|nr:site-specific integrase [Chloroflexota bacterium]